MVTPVIGLAHVLGTNTTPDQILRALDKQAFPQAFSPGQNEAETSRGQSTGHYQTESLASVLSSSPFRATRQQAK